MDTTCMEILGKSKDLLGIDCEKEGGENFASFFVGEDFSFVCCMPIVATNCSAIRRRSC